MTEMQQVKATLLELGGKIETLSKIFEDYKQERAIEKQEREDEKKKAAEEKAIEKQERADEKKERAIEKQERADEKKERDDEKKAREDEKKNAAAEKEAEQKKNDEEYAFMWQDFNNCNYVNFLYKLICDNKGNDYGCIHHHMKEE